MHLPGAGGGPTNRAATAIFNDHLARDARDLRGPRQICAPGIGYATKDWSRKGQHGPRPKAVARTITCCHGLSKPVGRSEPPCAAQASGVNRKNRLTPGGDTSRIRVAGAHRTPLSELAGLVVRRSATGLRHVPRNVHARRNGAVLAV